MVKENGQWITLQEASEITGKSINAIRLLIKRKKLNHIKKIQGKGHGYWVIHRDSIGQVVTVDQSPVLTTLTHGSDQSSQPLMVPFERYERERDKLLNGLMMYRYKFEEADRQLKMLPAPPEIVTKDLQDKDLALARAQEILDKAREDYDQYKTAIVELKEKLQEEERTKSELRQQLEMERRPWWKKMFGLKP